MIFCEWLWSNCILIVKYLLTVHLLEGCNIDLLFISKQMVNSTYVRIHKSTSSQNSRLDFVKTPDFVF